MRIFVFSILLLIDSLGNSKDSLKSEPLFYTFGNGRVEFSKEKEPLNCAFVVKDSYTRESFEQRSQEALKAAQELPQDEYSGKYLKSAKENIAKAKKLPRKEALKELSLSIANSRVVILYLFIKKSPEFFTIFKQAGLKIGKYKEVLAPFGLLKKTNFDSIQSSYNKINKEIFSRISSLDIKKMAPPSCFSDEKFVELILLFGDFPIKLENLLTSFSKFQKGTEELLSLIEAILNKIDQLPDKKEKKRLKNDFIKQLKTLKPLTPKAIKRLPSYQKLFKNEPKND